MKKYSTNTKHKSKLYQKQHLVTEIVMTKDITIGDFVKPDDMKKLNMELNEAKNLLSEYTDKKYDRIRNDLDIYRGLREIIRSKYNAQHVTNAWIKIWEICCHYNVKKMFENRINGNVPIKLFANAELPGSWTLAINHYLVCSGIKHKWWASSYVPSVPSKDNTALGDHYGVWEKNKSNWIMESAEGKNNGDCTIVENLLDFEKRLKIEEGGMDIYTHDAGIDVTGDYNNQELSNAKIHLGCALAGFLTLRTGGMCVFKQYTSFEPITMSLLTVYSTLFEKFYVCKPLTSRPYNSEIYLIGIGFIGLNKITRDLLFDKLSNYNEKPICSVPDSVMSEIKHFNNVVYKQQINMIKESVSIFKSPFNFSDIRNQLLDEWLKKYPLCRIDNNNQIPSN